MTRKIRYGDYLGLARTRHRVVSYNAITNWDSAHRRRPKLRGRDIHRLLTPYLGSRALDQARAVVPITLFLFLFQYLVLRNMVAGSGQIIVGIAVAILGLMLFMEGLRHGLMPFSENIGHLMPARKTYGAVLVVAFILGAAATFAEPAIGALKTAGSLTDPRRAPVLHHLLNKHPDEVVWAVAGSVGLAVLFSMLRFIQGWRMKRLAVIVTLPCLALTGYLAADPALAPVIGLAWDSGAITTGPVTVPIVLALGIGVSAAAGRGDNPLAGFGIVTLASLFPPMAVMLLGLHIGPIAPEPVVAQTILQTPAAASLTESTAAALRAIVPLALLLWLIQRVWLREPIRQPTITVYGILLAAAGMIAFYIGLGSGLAPLGIQSGNLLSTAFAGKDALYPVWLGLGLVFFFALALGFGATLAEPALNALGLTVQTLTDGAFGKDLLVRSVAIGVGLGTLLGVAKIVFQLPLAVLLIPAYLLALAMTLLSREEYVSLAWDSAGVTTGPVTVPLVLAMGLGLGQATGAHDGFGILAMASVGPIISVLAVGLWLNIRERFMQLELASAR